MTSHFQIAMFTAAAFLCVPAAAQEEAPAPFWVKQQAHTAEHTFMVQLIRYDDLHAPKAIKVIDRKSGAVVQEIADENGIEMSRPPEKFIKLFDANQDGHPDFSLAVNNGGAGPNNMDNFYLFNPTTRRYALHEGLSELSQVGIDSKGTITSASRGGCCQHGSASYRFIGGKLTQLTSLDEALSADGKWLNVTTGTFRGGKMRYKTKRQPLPPGY